MNFLRILWILGPVVLLAQDQVACPLASAKNGETIRLRGEAHQGGHDAWIRVTNCADRVIFVYADDPEIPQPKPLLKKDESFLRFRKYFDAEKAPQPNNICIGCFEYRVTAEFEGCLDVTESAGMKRDARTGKITGFVGFGHPMPFARYRLVVTSVTNIEAQRQ